jgi:hypothetical protein
MQSDKEVTCITAVNEINHKKVIDNIFINISVSYMGRMVAQIMVLVLLISMCFHPWMSLLVAFDLSRLSLQTPPMSLLLYLGVIITYVKLALHEK